MTADVVAVQTDISELFGFHFITDPGSPKFLSVTFDFYLAQSAGPVEYTDYTSAEGYNPPLHECPRYDTKQSDGVVPVMLELWRMRSTPSLPLLPGPLWPRMVPLDRVISMGQIELNCVLMLNWIVWNRTVLTFTCVWTKTILILNWIV